MEGNERHAEACDPVERATRQALPVSFDGIPDELRELGDRWVVWRYELDARGRLTKPPFDPRTGQRASHSDPGSWRGLQEAQEAYERSGGYAGIGLVLTGGLVGIDVDDCVTNGHLSPEALRLVRSLPTYFEYSPSRGGIRGLVFARLPGPHKRRGKVELYETSRYLTITGHRLPMSLPTITRDQTALDRMYAGIFPPVPRPDRPLKSRHMQPAPDEESILLRAFAARNGATFRRYLDGDPTLWSGPSARHPSKSEADFTFCLMLAYWTRGDAAMMVGIVRRSGLFDAKWDRPTSGNQTYGQRTIARALALSRTS